MTSFHRAAALAAILAACGAAQAEPVATIYGAYDASGIGVLPSAVTSGLTWNNDTFTYDTPSLFFVNSSAFDITDVNLQLTGYGAGTFNNGITQNISVGTLAANSVFQLVWNGAFSAGNLFASDYDDEYFNNYGANPLGAPGDAATDCTLNASGLHPEWFNYCAPVGNFSVTMTGTWNGQSVYSVFAETDTLGHYVGWEGVDPNGWSENATYDVHTDNVNGVLANINIGTPPTDVPEAPSYLMLAAGMLTLAGLFAAKRRANKI